MSVQQNEAIIEKAVEDFDYAISLRNFPLATQVIMNVRDGGFESVANMLGRELANKKLYA